ncbi:MAG: hypothetical protein EPN79_16010 [Burkholderiaceae bacterium]|nr:MAG: hypothetical protein EPN79_16010 [Burkholderiaceae bacterium]
MASASQTHSTPAPLNAQTLVGLLSRLMNMDMHAVAQVAGVPKKNMLAWIAGKRQALRLRSVVAILHTVGIRIESLRSVLDPERVHFWDVRVPLFGSVRQAFMPLTALSKMLALGVITEVRPARRQWKIVDRLFRRYFMVSRSGGSGVEFQVVVCVHTHPLRRARVTPEVVKGALWRDDSDSHCITVSGEAWHAITAHDMTVQEYRRAFESVQGQFDWADVTLMAREFGMTAEDVAQWMMRESGESQATAESEGQRYNVTFLLSHGQEAA